MTPASPPAARPRPSRLLLPLLALVAAAGCRGDADPGAADAPRERVVSVSKQINEFLYAIGGEESLVARDLTSVYPPRIEELPSVGYHRALSPEGIISMQPTLLLTDGNVGPEEVLERVKSVGIPVLELDPGSTPEEAQALLRTLGERFGREEAAEKVLAEWRAGMERVAPDSAGCADGSRPRVMLIHFGQLINNYLAVNAGSPADRMIRWAGGTNAIDSIGGMTRLTPELIAKAAPDVIVATDVGFDRFGTPEAFRGLPGVELTPAGENGRIHRIDESEIMYFGPRTPATVEKLRSFVCPGGAAS